MEANVYTIMTVLAHKLGVGHTGLSKIVKVLDIPNMYLRGGAGRISGGSFFIEFRAVDISVRNLCKTCDAKPGGHTMRSV